MPCATLLTLSSCHYHPKTNFRERGREGGRVCVRERDSERENDREGGREGGRTRLVL